MTIHALISGAPFAACAVSERSKPSTNAPPMAAALASNERRSIFGMDVMAISLSQAPAAAWIAMRIRWYVPQRQMLVIAASMSASVGFGFSLSSAATAMIIPL